jgi:hypothetical protein
VVRERRARGKPHARRLRCCRQATTAERGGVITEGYYAQVRYSQSRWETVALCATRMVATHIAADAYQSLRNTEGEAPHQVRVVSASQLTLEGGEREISLAAVDLAVRAEREQLLVGPKETGGVFRVHRARCPTCKTARTFVLRGPPAKLVTVREPDGIAAAVPAWMCRRCRTTVPGKDLEPPAPSYP